MLNFDPGEEKAFDLYERLEAKAKLKIEAANVLCGAFR
jgi:hypothetical protein